MSQPMKTLTAKDADACMALLRRTLDAAMERGDDYACWVEVEEVEVPPEGETLCFEPGTMMTFILITDQPPP